MKKLIPSLLLTIGILLSIPVTADVLLIDAIHNEPPNAPAGIYRPSRGMTMDTVKATFGMPDAEHAAVGEPPITRWDYPNYTVFFEHQYVLNSVVHR